MYLDWKASDCFVSLKCTYFARLFIWIELYVPAKDERVINQWKTSIYSILKVVFFSVCVQFMLWMDMDRWKCFMVVAIYLNIFQAQNLRRSTK